MIHTRADREGGASAGNRIDLVFRWAARFLSARREGKVRARLLHSGESVMRKGWPQETQKTQKGEESSFEFLSFLRPPLLDNADCNDTTQVALPCFTGQSPESGR